MNRRAGGAPGRPRGSQRAVPGRCGRRRHTRCLPAEDCRRSRGHRRGSTGRDRGSVPLRRRRRSRISSRRPPTAQDGQKVGQVDGDLGDEDVVSPDGHAGEAGDPARVAAHGLDHDDAAMALGCGSRRSTAWVTMLTAVSKPKEKSATFRSLSMVLGMPTTGYWKSLRSRRATPRVSSPPMTTRPSSFSRSKFSRRAGRSVSGLR